MMKEETDLVEDELQKKINKQVITILLTARRHFGGECKLSIIYTLVMYPVNLAQPSLMYATPICKTMLI